MKKFTFCFLICANLLFTTAVLGQKVPKSCEEQYRKYAYNFYAILQWMYELKYAIDYNAPEYKLLCKNHEVNSQLDIFKQKTDVEISQGLQAMSRLINNAPREILDACPSPEKIKETLSSEIHDALNQKRLAIQKRYVDNFQNERQKKKMNDEYVKNFCSYPPAYLPPRDFWEKLDTSPNYLYAFSKAHSAIVVNQNWDKEKSFDQFEEALKTINTQSK